MKKKENTLIFVTYDGINNPVFEGQVLKPLETKKKQYPNKKIILVSFERDPKKRKIPASNIEIILLKKIPFIGNLSLRYAGHQLKTILQQYPDAEIVARGAFAGWICVHLLGHTKNNIMVQARGLLAEEYRYAHNASFNNIFTSTIYILRYIQFKLIERYVYSHPRVTIEAVSLGMKEFLLQECNAHDKAMSIAQQDIPSIISTSEKTAWKNKIRDQLHIPLSAHVYCYCGSAKPWQCPEETVAYFACMYKKNPASFLLILSKDVQHFKKLTSHFELAPKAFHILSVEHKEIFSYLCACDTGLLFRRPDIINWVARPTKALEYHAAGLTIIHNNTVKYLQELQL